jgi:hypothetical protein
MSDRQRRRTLDGHARNPLFRYYAAHRRAWTPGILPPAVIASAVTFAVSWLAHPGTLATVTLGLTIGFVVARLRWAIWKRRHPIIPVDQYVTDLINERRRAARSN